MKGAVCVEFVNAHLWDIKSFFCPTLIFVLLDLLVLKWGNGFNSESSAEQVVNKFASRHKRPICFAKRSRFVGLIKYYLFYCLTNVILYTREVYKHVVDTIDLLSEFTEFIIVFVTHK